MTRYILLIAFILTAVSITARADDAAEFKHYSFSLSAVPGLQNSTDSSVPGENKISDKAYQFQLNYVNQPQRHIAGPFKQKLDYYSLRAFAYKTAYTDPEDTGAFADGVASVEGIAVLYGQRYLMSEQAYQGLGLGWYGGFATVKDTWVQKCCGATPTEENKTIPVVAAEVFYKFNVARNIYIEPVVTVAYEDKGTGPVDYIPALILGGEF